MTTMVWQSFEPRTPWMRGGIVSVVVHLFIALPFIIHLPGLQPSVSPAAVMVEYAPELEVSLIHPDLPAGISQQRKVEAKSEAEEKPQQKESPELPVVEHASLQMVARRPVHRAEKKQESKKTSRQQREEKGNSTVTSRAAPPAQAVVTQRNVAPLDTDSTQINSQKISWQALVKGKINRMRNYPDDAKRRKRSGTVVIMFSVNSRGEIVSSQLIDSSGTLSLDRAALTALKKAQPLPTPPPKILRNGIHTVTLPVEFNLLKIKI